MAGKEYTDLQHEAVPLRPFDPTCQETYQLVLADIDYIRDLPGVFGHWPLTPRDWSILKKQLMNEHYTATILNALPMPDVLRLVWQVYFADGLGRVPPMPGLPWLPQPTALDELYAAGFQGGVRHEFRSADALAPSSNHRNETTVDRPGGTCESEIPLTDTEKNIIEALGDKHMRGPQLLKRAGYEYSGSFRGILSQLVKRGILKHDKTGYFGPTS